MFRVSLFFIMLIFSVNTFSTSNLESIDLISERVRALDSDKYEFEREILYSNSNRLIQCDESQTEKLKKYQISAFEMITNWISDIQLYKKKLTPLVYNKSELKFYETHKKENLSNVYTMLRCILAKLPEVELQCNYQAGRCKDSKTVTAWTAPFFGKRIHLCEHYFKNESEESMIGEIIHEVAHKCGATDISYFNNFLSPPKSTHGIHWSHIADTYDYWATFGICIPGIDCKHKIQKLKAEISRKKAEKERIDAELNADTERLKLELQRLQFESI
jgi:hypothetical protein